MLVTRAPSAIYAALLFALPVCAVDAQQPKDQRQSSKISVESSSSQSGSMSVDFNAPPKPDPDPKATPTVEAPRTPSRPAVMGRVIPPPPRVVSRVSRSAGFIARPAVATSLAVNSKYGVRYDPLNGNARMHTGVDLHANYGDSVGASMSGTITFAGRRGGYGNLVVVDHGSGVSTFYAHLSAITVYVGQPVGAGEVIGMVGSTGRSTGPHLHYEVRGNGRPFDPFSEVAVYDGGMLGVGGHRIGPDSLSTLSGRVLPLPPSDATVISVDFDKLEVDTDE